MRKIVQLCVVLLLCLKGMAVDVHLTGRVYFDNDRSYFFSNLDSAFNGAEVKFSSPSSNIYTAITDKEGYYELYLPAGDYNYILNTPYNTQRYETLRQDVNDYVILTNDESVVNFVVPINQLARVVGGKVYYDNNRNRKQDGGDAVAPNSKITLNIRYLDGELSTTTDDWGIFRFYDVFLQNGSDLTIKGWKTNYLERIIYGFTGGFREFYIQPDLPGKAHIDGKVFYDIGGDGYNWYDSVISNSTVTATNIKTQAIVQTQTDSSGDYYFNVDTGYYKIEFTGNYDNKNYLASAPASGYYSRGNISEYDDIGTYRADFGLQLQPDYPIDVSGRVYFDNNRNGFFDEGDSTFNQGPVLIRTTDYRNNYTTTANSNGIYHRRVPAGSYYIVINLDYDADLYKTYEPSNSIYRNYWLVTSDTTDSVDIAIVKRKDIESGLVDIRNTSNEYWAGITPSASVQDYVLSYNYRGGLKNLSGRVSLDYNPFITFTTADRLPTSQRAGHLEWAVDSLLSGTDYFIGLKFHYPAMGDTIDAMPFTAKLSLQLPIGDTVFQNHFKQDIDHPQQAPIGSTKGVKWSRTFPRPENIYVSGYGNGIDTILGGNGYFVLGGEDYFAAKMNKDGLTVWQTMLDSLVDNGSKVYGHSITHTKDGGCLVIGNINQYINNQYEGDGMIAIKLDSNGNLQWKTIVKGSKSEGDFSGISGVTELQGGGYFLMSDTKSNDGDFTNNRSDTTHSNVFLTKLSASGNIVWTKVYGGSNEDGGIRILPLKNGTFLLLAATASSDGDVVGAHKHGIQYIDTYDGGSDTSYNAEAWLLNIDGNGNILWSKCYGGTGFSYFAGAVETNDGILLTGMTNSKDGDLPYYEGKGVPLWVTKVSTTGQILWTKIFPQYKGYNAVADTLDQDFFDFGSFTSHIRTKKDGSFLVGGTIADKYGELKSKHGGHDMLLVNISAAGNIIWQKAIGGTGYDEINDIQLDNDENVVFVGSTSSDNDDFYEHGNGSLVAVGKFGITNTISGHVFTDLNGNHLKDANEVYNNEGRIYSAKQSDTTIARIFSGQFLNNVDTGNYVTTYVPASEYFTIFPASKNSAFTSFDQSDSVDFALVPKANIKDLQTVITPLTPARPGFESSYRIITKNVGTANITNAVISLKKDSRQTYTSASRPNTGIAADSVWWGPFNINAFTNDTLDVVLTQAVPPVLQNGDTLNIALYALPLANDTTPANNKASVRQIVQGSFDPNDKTEAHAGIYTPTMKASNEPFQYLIRFQNTGTDTAFYVTVKDTLDAKVDVNSLETITASHPYKFTLEGRIATWQFNKILLVDSTTNEPASHGFISFTIKPSATLKLGDSVTNKAAIYFDFNLPVITNKSLLLLVSDKSVICPGGSTQFQAGQTGIGYQWQINTGNGFTNLANGGIYSGTTTQTLLISNAPSTLYGTQYRCVVTLQGGGKAIGDTYKLTFANTWAGTVSTAWENASNWSCGSVPDENTDVIIKTGTPNTPSVNAATTVRSISASTGAKVMVKTGVLLLIKGKN